VTMAPFFQLLINTLHSGLIFALVGVSFDLVYRTTKFFHFAHAAIFLCAAYGAFAFSLIWPRFWIAAVVGILIGVVANVSMELGVFAKMRSNGASALTFLLVSLGLYVVAQNIVSLVFGDGTRVLWTSVVAEGIDLHGGYITPVQLFAAIASVVLVCGTHWGLSRSRTGKALRAVSADSELAEACGLPIRRVNVAAFAISGALAGAVAILVSMDVGLNPNLGLQLLFIGVVVMIMGGVGSIWGAVIAGLFLATAQNAAVWWLSSAWQDAITFGLLWAFLLFRPQGIFGRKAPARSV
jgi:branched-chain amino acid transport system permease protein